MQYKVLVIADLHWGVMDDIKMYNQYQYILDYVRSNPLDIIVIAGDYFELKLYLNSRRAIRALEWFDELYNLAKENGVQKIRMIRGTLSHDADQMDVFKKYSGDGFFRVIENCISEETLPGLQCLYCPDEIITTKNYVIKYIDALLSKNDVAFFHGSFDVVLRQDIDVNELMKEEDDENEMNVITSITFPMNYFQQIIKYCCVGGHWHDGNEYENIYYVGSPTRWIHGENKPKGIAVLTIDTDREEYDYEKILNPHCPQYITHEIRPDNIEDNDQYMEKIEDLIREIKADVLGLEEACLDYNIRIVVYETEKTVTSQNVIRVLKDAFVDNENVVIRIKSKDKKKKKKDEVIEEEEKDYSFIKNKSLSVAKQIYEFIKIKNGEEVPLEYIEKMVDKYST